MEEPSNLDFVAARESEQKRKALHRCCGNYMRSLFDTCAECALKEQDCLCVEDALKALRSRSRSYARAQKSAVLSMF